MASAQPVITQNHLSNSLQTQALVADSAAFDPGTPGPNKTWDFSQLAPAPVGTANFVAASGAPGFSVFPAANSCLAYTGDVLDIYEFYKASDSKLELLGMLYTGLGTVHYGINPKTIVTFPYTYNQVIDGLYGGNADEAPTAFTSTYDAYGTLILPFGTYPNVLRQKIEENGQTEYIWYNASPFFPIIQTALADGSVGILKNTAILANDAFTATGKPVVFPNPTQGAFTITLTDAQDATVEVYDVLGHRIAATNLSGTSARVDLQDQPQGIYIVKTTTANGLTHNQKIIKS